MYVCILIQLHAKVCGCIWLLGSITHCMCKSIMQRSSRLSVCLSVSRQISKTKQDRREISSPSYEIGVAEQEYPKSSPNPQIAQNNVRAYCLAPLAMQLVGYCCWQCYGTLCCGNHSMQWCVYYDRPLTVMTGWRRRAARSKAWRRLQRRRW